MLIFKQISGLFDRGPALVSRRKFAAALTALRAASRIGISGGAVYTRSNGVSIVPNAMNPHPFALSSGAPTSADFAVAVAPGLVMVPGTAASFILSSTGIDVPDTGFICVRVKMRRKVEEADIKSGNNFTGEVELSTDPELTFVTTSINDHMTPNWKTPSCTYGDFTIPLGYADPNSASIVPFIRSSISIWPPEAVPDLDFIELL